jgi:hypothetical protein
MDRLSRHATPSDKASLARASYLHFGLLDPPVRCIPTRVACGCATRQSSVTTIGPSTNNARSRGPGEGTAGRAAVRSCCRTNADLGPLAQATADGVIRAARAGQTFVATAAHQRGDHLLPRGVKLAKHAQTALADPRPCCPAQAWRALARSWCRSKVASNARRCRSGMARREFAPITAARWPPLPMVCL